MDFDIKSGRVFRHFPKKTLLIKTRAIFHYFDGAWFINKIPRKQLKNHINFIPPIIIIIMIVRFPFLLRGTPRPPRTPMAAGIAGCRIQLFHPELREIFFCLAKTSWTFLCEEEENKRKINMKYSV